MKNYYFSKIIVVFQDICPVWGSTCKVIRDPLNNMDNLKKYFLFLNIVLLFSFIFTKGAFCEDEDGLKFKESVKKLADKSIKGKTKLGAESRMEFISGPESGNVMIQGLGFKGSAEWNIFKISISLEMMNEYELAQYFWIHESYSRNNEEVNNFQESTPHLVKLNSVRLESIEKEYYFKYIEYNFYNKINFSESTISDKVFYGYKMKCEYDDFELFLFTGTPENRAAKLIIVDPISFSTNDNWIGDEPRPALTHGGRLQYRTIFNEANAIFYIDDTWTNIESQGDSYKGDPFYEDSLLWLDFDIAAFRWLEFRGGSGMNIRTIKADYLAEYTNNELIDIDESTPLKYNKGKYRDYAYEAGLRVDTSAGVGGSGFTIDSIARSFGKDYHPRMAADFGATEDKPYKNFRTDQQGVYSQITYILNRLQFQYFNDFWQRMSDLGLKRHCNKLQISYDLFGVDVGPFVDYWEYFGYPEDTSLNSQYLQKGSEFLYRYEMNNFITTFKIEVAENHLDSNKQDKPELMHTLEEGVNFSYIVSEDYDFGFNYERKYFSELGSKYVSLEEGKYINSYYFRFNYNIAKYPAHCYLRLETKITTPNRTEDANWHYSQRDNYARLEFRTFYNFY